MGMPCSWLKPVANGRSAQMERDHPNEDAPISACVVHDKKDEEDFRQMKDFWKLEDFKSTQYNYVTYHIIMTLMGYLFFQEYKNLEERQAYVGRPLPIVVKNHNEVKPKAVVIYVGQYFSISRISPAICRIHVRSKTTS